MANLVRRDPFGEMVSLRDAMDRLFEESFIYPFGTERRRGNGFRTPELDLYETDDDVVVEASVPGLEPEDIDISVAGNTLSLKGEMKHEEEKEEKGTYYFRERRYGSFQRTLTLPTEVKSEQADARFENGVLKLTLPKAEEVKPKRITVKAK